MVLTMPRLPAQGAFRHTTTKKAPTSDGHIGPRRFVLDKRRIECSERPVKSGGAVLNMVVGAFMALIFLGCR